MGSLDGLNPELQRRLLAMQAAAQAAGTNITWGSGVRTVAEQAALRRSNGCPDVWSSPASSCRVPTAIPGQSNHNHGFAMDIGGDKGWANANAQRFGLHFPIDGEDWHVEMVDDDGSHSHMQGAQGRGAIGFNMNWQENPGDATARRDEMLQGYMDVITSAHEDALVTSPADDPMLAAPTPAMSSTPDMSVGGVPSLQVPEQLDATTMPGRQQPAGRAQPVPGAGGDIKSMVRGMAEQMGWGADQWPALERLVQKESSWNPSAQNPTSTAYGLFQFLNGTWKNYGQKTSDPTGQAQAGLAYIRDRYGSPTAALAFHERNNWY